MPANRHKSGGMPDASTAFFGRNHTQLEPLYAAALANLTRDTFLAFRDTRVSLIQTCVSEYVGLAP